MRKTKEEKIDELVKYLDQELDARRKIHGRSYSLAAFARELGIPPANLNRYINGYQLPDPGNAYIIAQTLPHVLTIMQLPQAFPKNPMLKVIVHKWDELSVQQQEEFYTFFLRITTSPKKD